MPEIHATVYQRQQVERLVLAVMGGMDADAVSAPATDLIGVVALLLREATAAAPAGSA